MTDHLPVVIADTTPLLHLFDRCSPYRETVLKTVERAGHVVLSPLVLCELDYLALSRMGVDAELEALDYVITMTEVVRWSVPEVTPHLREARHLIHRYRDMDGGSGIGLADAVNVVLAREFATNALLTFDVKHFRALRPLTSHDAFRLLPDDA